MSYTEHTNWIDFGKYDLPKPIYINLVRHPIRKVMSAYYYIRQPHVHKSYAKKYNRLVDDKYFNMTFNDCVKEGKREECIFDAHIKYNSDWRRGVIHFCGNQKVCMYVVRIIE